MHASLVSARNGWAPRIEDFGFCMFHLPRTVHWNQSNIWKCPAELRDPDPDTPPSLFHVHTIKRHQDDWSPTSPSWFLFWRCDNLWAIASGQFTALQARDSSRYPSTLINLRTPNQRHIRYMCTPRKTTHIDGENINRQRQLWEQSKERRDELLRSADFWMELLNPKYTEQTCSDELLVKSVLAITKLSSDHWHKSKYKMRARDEGNGEQGEGYLRYPSLRIAKTKQKTKKHIDIQFYIYIYTHTSYLGQV